MVFRPLPAVLAFLITWVAAGQTASLRGPVSGLIYDHPSRSIRPVVGFPGSSYLGQPALRDVETVFLAPDGESALVVEDGQVVLIRGLRNGNLTKILVSELNGQVDHVAWASSSGSLVAYCSSMRRLLRLDVRTSPPMSGPSTDLSYLEGDVTGVVTNDDASLTVIGFRHPTQGGLYAVSEGAPPVQLSATKDPGAAVFADSANVLYAIDRDARQILRFPNGVYGGWEWLSFSGESERLADPVGIALSPDGQRLYVAGGVDRMIREYDLRSLELLLEIRLDVIPQGLSPLPATSSVFVLGPQKGGEQPTWLLDARRVPSVSFVPAGK
jgi:WD40 repeat protein